MASCALMRRIATIRSVNVPPAWKAMRGSKDKPIIMQKMAREPKPHALSTVSKAMRRMSSTVEDLRSTECVRHHSEFLAAGWPIAFTIAWAGSIQTNFEKVPDGGKRQQTSTCEPDPERDYVRFLFRAHDAFVDRSGNACENDGCRR